MVCTHKKVIIFPTLDNVWNINDYYILECFTCNEILLKNNTIDEIIDYININKCSITDGEKYIPLSRRNP